MHENRKEIIDQITFRVSVVRFLPVAITLPSSTITHLATNNTVYIKIVNQSNNVPMK